MTIRLSRIPTVSKEVLVGFVWKRDPRAFPYVRFDWVDSDWPLDRDEDFYDMYMTGIEDYDPKILLVGYGPLQQDKRRLIATITEIDHGQRLARFGFENPSEEHLHDEAPNTAAFIPEDYEVVLDA